MSASIVPASKPRQAKVESLALADGLLPGFDTKAWLLGVRGYYRDTMGEYGVNDRGIYDDAIFLVSPDCHMAFNANTDPSVARTGVAVLKTGLWLYKWGIHGITTKKPHPSGTLEYVSSAYRYEALVQADEVTVIRDKRGPDTGWFGVNIHRGSYTTTSSLGCQTIHPDQWAVFRIAVKQEMKQFKQVIIPYLLIDGPTR